MRNFSGMRLLALALVVAVAALSAVGFVVQRVEQALQREAASTLAADWVLEQGRPMPPAWREQAEARGLAASELVSFPSVLFLNDAPQLVQVKGVQANYPLRGRLLLANAAGEQFQRAPLPGEAWPAARLQRQLGDADVVPLGQQSLANAGTLIDEPDLAGNLFQLAPRLLVHWDDVHASGLLGPAARARYRLLVAGDTQALEAFQAWLKPQLDNSTRVLSPRDGRPEMNTAIQRGERFLGLAALCASLLAGIAMLLATRRFVQQALDEVAVLRTLGMTSAQVMWRYTRQLLSVTVLAALVGAALGYLAQLVLLSLAADWWGSALPAAGPEPLIYALGHALVLVLGFAMPSLLSLRQVPPLRVLRRDLGPPSFAGWLLGLIALSAYTALIWAQVKDAELALSISFGMAAVLAAFALLALVVLWLLRVGAARGELPLGLAALARQPGMTALQLSGFGVALTLLLLLSLVRVDLMTAWSDNLPEQAPNYFLLNIQPDEIAALRSDLQELQISGSGFYPTTRARLLAINEQTVVAEDFAAGRAQRLVSREYSLGFGAQLPADNRIEQGRMWAAGEAGWSLEADFAKSLELQVGDVLRFDIAGQTVSAPVLSLRSVAWDSFNVNFFVQGSPALLANLPHAYLSSVYVDAGQEDALHARLGADYPAVSALAIGALIEKVRAVIDRGALAVQGVFVFTLAAAVLIGLAAVQISREQRAAEIALLRTFGASRRRVWRLLLSEFVLLGVLAGGLAALVSNLLSVQLAERLFALDIGLSPALWAYGTLGGALLLGLLGWLAVSPLLRTPPLQVLRS